MGSQEAMIGFAREALGLSESIPLSLSLLEGRGSDRTFFRLHWKRKESVILIHYDPKRIENSSYAGIAAFLHDIHIPVPRLIGHDPGRCLIVMEDLGKTDLWSFRNAPWKNRRPLYEKTLLIVHRLHSFPERDFPSARVRLMEGFGPGLYRWEQNYFRDHFVRDVCGINLEPSFDSELTAELLRLAERLAGGMRCLIHRDLQSKNVMIRDGEPFLIDFQGMRLGSPFYDLGSLLCDPYVEFSNSELEELLSFYHGLLNRAGRNRDSGLDRSEAGFLKRDPAKDISDNSDWSKWNMDWTTFQAVFWEASAQRLMQALGAYGFLGLRKGLKAFLEHIPPGLRHLHNAASHAASFPRLLELTMECQRVIERRDIFHLN